MSWSVMLIGHPDKIAEALEARSAGMTGQSLVEYEAAKPHLVALVKENFSPEGQSKPVLKLSASGSGYGSKPEDLYRSCLVQIQTLDGTLV